MERVDEQVTIPRIRAEHRRRESEVRQRLQEFSAIWESRDDQRIWAEMVYCFFTGGCSAVMGLRSVEAVRPLLANGTSKKVAERLKGVHRYPNARARYVADSRKYLKRVYDMRLWDVLGSMEHHARRDWLVNEKGIKGLGYKEASHFLRNIGFRGYAILDKHVLRCLADLKIIDDPKPPTTRSRYLTVEDKLKKMSSSLKIDFDEMDLVLWSLKTGKVLK